MSGRIRKDGIKMNGVTPIIIPYITQQPKCPKCGKDEDKITVCAHCGHEYGDIPLTTPKKVGAVIGGIFILWFALTLIWWGLETAGDGDGARSLWEIIKSQWESVKNLRLW